MSTLVKSHNKGTNTTKSDLIVKSNYLIEASYKLWLTEMKIISKLVSTIQKDDVDFKVYSFKTGELLHELKLWKNNYKELDIASDKLLAKTLTIKRKNGGVLKVNLLSSFEYKKSEWIIEMCFDPKLREYLLQVKGFHTSYTLRNIVSLKSYSSIRVYELLKQYLAIGNRTITIVGLREFLWISENQYQFYSMFKKRIILQAQIELEKYTDISFDFNEIKEWRRVVAIKFTIHNKKKTAFKKLLLQDEREAKEKLTKEQVFYQKEDAKLQNDVLENQRKKQLVSEWIKSNPKEYEQLLLEKGAIHLVRAYVQINILKI